MTPNRLTDERSAVLLFVAAFPFQYMRPASTDDVAKARGYSRQKAIAVLASMRDSGYLRNAPGMWADCVARWQLPTSLRGVA